MTNTDPRDSENIKNRAKQIEQLAPKMVTNTDQELEKIIKDACMHAVGSVELRDVGAQTQRQCTESIDNDVKRVTQAILRCFIPLEEHNRKMVEAELKGGKKQLHFADGVISSYHTTSEQLQQIQNRLTDLNNQLNKKDVK